MSIKNQTIRNLAILGGRPAFNKKLVVGCPNIGNRKAFLKRINELLDSRWLSNDGPYVKEFEKRIASMLGVKHCIATCNGTLGLEIASRAIGLSGEVILPSFTFVATAHALQWQGITPVFCDIDPLTHNLDPCLVESLVTSRTTGIIGVHLWGRPCNMEVLSDISQRNNLKLLFDAAHAFCCSYKGSMIGNFGNAEVFSFHATKFFNTFEGGAIVTNDDELAEKLQLMRNFGFADYDQVSCLGINGKMNEVSAVMGLTSLESIEEFIKANCRNYKKYKRLLAGIPGVSLMIYDESDKCNYQYIVLEIDKSITGISRDELQKILWMENIMARRYFYPGCHRMEPYNSYYPHAGLRLPQTEDLTDRVLSLPTGTAVRPGDIDKVCQIIRFIMTHGDAVKERLRRQASG
jgi:dTDP-4-amino-4,6-dideoxygalactose transaminase